MSSLNLKFTLQNIPAIMLEILPVVAWLFLFQRVLGWLGKVFLVDLKLFNMILLAGIIFLLARAGQKPLKNIRLDWKFNWNLWAFSLCITAALLYPLVWMFFPVNIVSGFIFGWGTYGLLGLYLPRKTWIKSFVPVLLILQTMPFGPLLDTYIGFPLRIAATQMIQALFMQLGFADLGSETILLIENKAAQIDLNCSGIKGIWSATLFYFAITWIEGWRIRIKWLLGFVVHILLIFVANLFRITVLVFLTTIYDMPKLADAIHEPLGLFGFLLACALTYLWIRNQKKKKLPQKEVNESPKTLPSNRFKSILGIGIAFLFLLPAWFFPAAKKADYTAKISQFSIPKWNLEKTQLTQEEVRFFSQEGGQAIKFRFRTDSFSGSLLLVAEGPWRSHHRPEVCAQAKGYKVNGMRTLLLSPDFPVRQLDLGPHDNNQFYWFQSPQSVTEDFSSRIWAELTGQQGNWTMVSLLLDNKTSKDHPDLKKHLNAIRKAVHTLHTQPSSLTIETSTHEAL